MKYFFLLMLPLFFILSSATNYDETLYVKIRALDTDIPRIENNIKSFKLDDVGDRYITAYINKQELYILEEMGFFFKLDRPENYQLPITKEDMKGYFTYETLTTEMNAIHKKYPTFTELFSIGRSVQGRELWVMKVSDNAAKDENEPEIILSSTMHGDEVVGMELMMKLIKYLLENYNTDTQIKNLVDNIEIFIMPDMNPDGTFLKTRYNANGVDLNRDFPDFTSDPNNTLDGRAIETQNMMKFVWGRNFSLGANFHGGAVVVNMPWDTTPEVPPDEDFITKLGNIYASQNQEMVNSNDFPGGVTNGYAWYEVNGGLQDWIYYYEKAINFTIELSGTKWPQYTEIDKYWNENKKSLINFIAESLRGIHGTIIDSKTKKPITAEIKVEENQGFALSSYINGDFHKHIYPGTYTLSVSADNYKIKTIKNVVVPIEGTINNLVIELDSK